MTVNKFNFHTSRALFYRHVIFVFITVICKMQSLYGI